MECFRGFVEIKEKSNPNEAGALSSRRSGSQAIGRTKKTDFAIHNNQPGAALFRDREAVRHAEDMT